MTLQQYWTQPTAHTQRTDLRPGLEARVQDPLWLLLRQWQMGELRGEDAGTPILAEAERDAFGIDRLELDGQAQAYAPAEAPLEAVVERETKDQVIPDLRTRAQGGRMMIRMLEAAQLALDPGAFATLMAFPPDDLAAAEAAGAGARMLATASPDARALYTAFASGPLTDGQLAGLLPGAGAPFEPYRQVIGEWIARYEARAGKPGEGDAWLEQRLEYSFGVSVPTDAGRVELAAPEYHGGRLDWDAFEVATVDTADTVAVSDRQRESMLVTPVSYAGMPAPRFWEFEDARVDFGDPDTGENDLGRLLLAEFAMAWGNDWFQIPVTAPLGGLCRINELLVRDTFGVTTRILPQASHTPYWGIGRLSQRAGTPDLCRYLFLAPVLPAALQGAPIEEVRLLRDEMANMAWAVEQTVATPLGRPRPIADEELRPRRGFTRPQTAEALLYRPMTDLPRHWIPLLPMRDAATSARYLVRGGLLDELQAQAPEPAGELLSAAGFQVHEEEIPRAGAILTRAYQLSRWHDGRRTVWLGRRKRSGAGETRSGLEFDRLLGAGSQ